MRRRSETLADMAARSSRWWQGLFGVLALGAAAAAGCEKSRSMADLEAASERTASEVRQEIGPDAHVGYLRSNGRTRVTISLVYTTAAEADAVRPQVEAIVRRHYPEADQIVVENVPRE
jgi:hypothetical protein